MPRRPARPTPGAPPATPCLLGLAADHISNRRGVTSDLAPAMARPRRGVAASCLAAAAVFCTRSLPAEREPGWRVARDWVPAGRLDA